jgi:NhaP-type Na+/H+ or K+/H+ antiporter
VKNLVTAVVMALACVAGLWPVSVDTRTDDTGIVALGVSIAGALLGAYLGIIVRRTASSTSA